MQHIKKSELVVRCASPKIHDAKELHTIVLFSLRHLFGDLESHSYDMMIEPYSNRNNNHVKDFATEVAIIDYKHEATYFVIRCRTESVSAIRASLTMVTPPPYMDEDIDRVYQLDVMKVV